MDALSIWIFAGLFVAGQVVLGIAAWGIWRFFHRSVNLPQRLAAVREYPSRRKRVESARAELERARAEAGVVHKLLARARQLARDQVETIDSPAHMVTAVSFFIVTFIVLEGDAALWVLLNGASGMFGLGFMGWALLGSWAAFGVFSVMHMLAVAVIDDAHRPARTLKRARVFAIIMGALVVAGVWTMLSGRGIDFTQAGWAPDAIQYGMWVLTFVLAACGAFTAIVANVSLGQARVGSQVVALETRAEEYTRHIEALETEITKYGDAAEPPEAADEGSRPATPTPGPDVTVTPSRAVVRSSTAAALFIALALGPSVVTAHAEDRASANVVSISNTGGPLAGAPSGVPRWLTEVTTPAPGECENLQDVSGSMGDVGRRGAAEGFLRSLPQMLGAYGCRVIRVSAFSGDAPFQAIEEFVVPSLKAAANACEEETTSVGKRRNAMRFLYPALRERDKVQLESQCRELQRADEARLASLRASAVADIGSAVVRLSRTPARGSCTAIYQAAARALRRSAHVVVVTDGASTCRWYRQANGMPFSVAVPPGSTLLFLLVPTVAERDAGGDEALERAAALKMVFPGATVQLLNEATPAFWRAVGAAPSSK